MSHPSTIGGERDGNHGGQANDPPLRCESRHRVGWSLRWQPIGRSKQNTLVSDLASLIRLVESSMLGGSVGWLSEFHSLRGFRANSLIGCVTIYIVTLYCIVLYCYMVTLLYNGQCGESPYVHFNCKMACLIHALRFIHECTHYLADNSHSRWYSWYSPGARAGW
jgi:hypothetical protein